jgi:tetratricopeptide (TPR) repeat protein
MDALTLILIAIGVIAVGALVVLGYLEIRRNAGRAQPAPPSDARGQAGELRGEAAAPFVQPARAEAEARPAALVAPARAPATRATGAALTAGQRAALARLTVMQASFNREVAIAVADCPGEDIEALLASGLLVGDETGSRLDLTAAARGMAAGALGPEEARAARLRHAQYFIHLGEEAIASTGNGVKAPGGVETPPVVAFAEEKAHFEQAFAFLTQYSDLAAEVFRLVDAVGWGHAIQLEPAECVRWADAALTAARMLRDKTAERDALDHLGSAHTEAGSHEDALGCYDQAAALSRELGDRLGEGRFIGNAGLSHHRMGRPAQAVEAYEAVLTIMRELGDRPREAIALASLGQAAADLGDHRKAIGYFEQFLEIAVETADRRAMAMALANLGAAHGVLGEDERAADYHDRELQVAQGLRDLHAEMHALGAVGGLSRKRGDLERAVQCFTRQVEVAHLLKDGRAGVQAIGELGLCHLQADRASKALECFEEQLTIARKIRDRAGEGQALWYAARVVHSRGQIADAITRASAAVPIFDEIKSPEAAKLRAEIDAWRSEV